jgi:hypothetical protein
MMTMMFWMGVAVFRGGIPAAFPPCTAGELDAPAAMSVTRALRKRVINLL